FLKRLFLGESRRNLDSPRLRLRGRAAACAAWRLHARCKRPFLAFGGAAVEQGLAASIRHSPSRNHGPQHGTTKARDKALVSGPAGHRRLGDAPELGPASAPRPAPPCLRPP